jgi:hypothetical protein
MMMSHHFNMTQPIRVQRKRIKGWRMPANTKCVTRGTKFGNPFTFGEFMLSLTLVNKVRRIEVSELTDDAWLKWSLESFEEYINNKPDFIDLIKKELKGYNLACFCPLNKPCHVDILLKVANS